MRTPSSSFWDLCTDLYTVHECTRTRDPTYFEYMFLCKFSAGAVEVRARSSHASAPLHEATAVDGLEKSPSRTAIFGVAINSHRHLVNLSLSKAVSHAWVHSSFTEMGTLFNFSQESTWFPLTIACRDKNAPPPNSKKKIGSKCFGLKFKEGDGWELLYLKLL